MRIILLAIFLLFVNVAYAIPTPYNISVDPDPHPYFEDNRTYFFNVTWIGQNITNTTIEHNFTGILANFSTTKVGNIYRYNTSNITSGSYIWRSFANDSTGINFTDVQNYTVKKGIPIIQLFINGSLANVTSFAPNVPINITVDLFSNVNKIPNADFESVRFDNESLPINWFYKSSDEFADGDNSPWIYSPLIKDSFSGGKALLVNVTQLVDDNFAFIASRIIDINPSTQYTLLFHVKNVTFGGTNIDFGNVVVLEFEANGPPLFTNLWRTVVRFNSTHSQAGDNRFVVNQKNVGNGWREITVNFTTSSNGEWIKIEPYYNDADANSYYFLDDFVLLSAANRINKTAFINTTFPNYLQVNGSSPFTNITITPSEVATHNVTGIFFGDANYSAGNETHFAIVGNPAALFIATNSSFQQGTATGYKVYMPFQVRYTNATNTAQVIAGASCSVSNNQSSDSVSLTFNSTTGNYTCTGTNCMDNYLLYGNARLTASCSGNITFAPQSNGTNIDVIFQNYLWELPNQTYGESKQNSTKWLRYNRSTQSQPINVSKSLSIDVNSSNNSFITFILEDNSNTTNRSLDRTLTFSGGVTLRANISIANTACMPKLCFQIQDNFLNPLLTRCAAPQNISAAIVTIVEQNVTVNATADVNTYLAFLVRCDANVSFVNATETNITLFYNYSSLPNIETKNAIANPIKATIIKQVQNEANYTIGPNSAINATWNETIEFNNTISTLQVFAYSMIPRIASSDKIFNTSISVFTRTGFKLSHTFADGIIKWTTEKLPGSRKTNETVKYTVINAIQDSESLIFQRIGESVWTVNVSSNLFPQIGVRNVTAFTDYSAYGALAGWTFRINITNTSGTFGITNLSTISGNTITFPPTNLSSVTYRINATGLSNGAACSADNQCGTGVCCDGACATACVTTKVITTGGGAGGSIVLEPAGMSASVPSQTEALLGATGTLHINITNVIKDSVLRNVSVAVKGYLPGFVSVFPEKIDNVSFNETKSFLVTLSVPIFLTEREYALEIITTANFTRSNEIGNITKVLFSRLIVNPLLEKPPERLLLDTGKLIEELAKAGFGVNRVTGLFSALKTAVDNRELAKADRIAKEISGIKQRAFAVAVLINEAKRRIEEARVDGLDVTATQRLLDLAIEAFAREDYEKAEQRTNTALLTYTAETGGKINLIAFVKNNWPWLLILSIVLFFAVNSAYRRITLFFIGHRLKRLEQEEKTIRDMIAQERNDYFQKRIVSQSEYHRTMYNFERRLRKIRAKTMWLISKMAGIVGAESEMQTLLRERDYIIQEIKGLQVRYFEKRSITRGDYSKGLQDYKARLAELEEQRELLKLKKKGRIRLLTERILNVYYKIESAIVRSVKSIFRLAIIVVFVVNTAFAVNITDAESALVIAENQINGMSQAGFAVQSVNDTLNRAKTLFLKGGYESVLILTKQINITATKAFEISSVIEAAENKVFELSKLDNVSSLRSLLNNATVAFYKEDYLAAKEFADTAFSAAEELESKLAVAKAEAKEDIVTLIRANIYLIAVMITISSIGGKILYTRHRINWRRNRLIFLDERRKLIRNLIKEIQEKYFLQKTLSSYEYKMKMDSYNRKLHRIKSEEMMLKEKIRKGRRKIF